MHLASSVYHYVAVDIPATKRAVVNRLHLDDVVPARSRSGLVVVIDDVDAARPPVQRAVSPVKDDVVAKVEIDRQRVFLAGNAGLRPALLASRLW